MNHYTTLNISANKHMMTKLLKFLPNLLAMKRDSILLNAFWNNIPFLPQSLLIFTGLILTTPGEKDKAESKRAKFYNELWFAVLMVVLGLILLAILLSLILQRKVHKQPYARDRPPLVPLQKRMSPMSVYSSGETHPVRLVKCNDVVYPSCYTFICPPTPHTVFLPPSTILLHSVTKWRLFSVGKGCLV